MASDRHGLSEILWQLPRTRRLRREILLQPIFKSLLNADGAALEHFVQQSSFLLKSFKSLESKALLDATRILEDELQLFSTFGIADASPLPAVNAYVTYVKDLLPREQGVAVALRGRLVLWLCQTFLKADGITAKSFRRWLEFGASHYQQLSLQLDQKLDQSQNLNEFRDMYLQLMQHEHTFFSELATRCHLEEPIQKKLLQVAQIIPPRVLIIAGSDSGGGAGLQADLKSCTVQGVFATTAVTAVTAQNTHGVQGIFPIPIDFLKKQVHSVLSDLGTDVVKTGMLATAEIVKAVAAALKATQRLDSQLVVDPVMVSTSGHTLLEDDAIQSLKEELFPHATIITPNLPEARLLLGLQEINTVAAMEDAARKLAMMGPQWVLVKGGHLPGSDQAVDILCEGGTGACVAFKSTLVAKTKHTHGTGCTLASSIAAYLARGLEVPEAVQAAKDFVSGAIANSAHLALGDGKQGPMNHSWPYFDW